MDRTLIDAEPAIVTHDGGVYVFDEGGVTVTVQDSVKPTPTSLVLNAGDTQDDAIVKITGKPCGEWENLAKLWPYASFRRGQNIFSTDKPLTVHTTSGRKLTVASAALTKSPDIDGSPDKPLLGSVEWTGVRLNNTPWSTAGSLYSEAAVAFVDWSAFDQTQILKVAFAAAWGALAAPWNGIVTMDGWAISFGLQLKYVMDAAIGTVQAFYVGETVVAKCRSLNVTMADIIAIHEIQGGTARRGKRIATGNNLVLTGAGGSPVITLTSAALRSPGFRFGNEEIRIGEIGFEAQRTFTTGQPQPLYTLA
jgi:hypothetical protein